MPVHFVACVFPHKGLLKIGRAGNLIPSAPLKADMAHFRRITLGHTVVMGRKTWDSLPANMRPLPDRENFVISNNTEQTIEGASVMNVDEFEELYSLDDTRVFFVIGGGEIFRSFKGLLSPHRIYLTEVTPLSESARALVEAADVTMPAFSVEYLLIDVSDKSSIVEETGNGEKWRYQFMVYQDPEFELISVSEAGFSPRVETGGFKLNDHYNTLINKEKLQNCDNDIYNRMNRDPGFCAKTEYPYLNLLREVLAYGKKRGDRTGVGTYSMFGAQMRFDISETVPLLTTKRVPWKTCIEELLWFLRGDTDAKILQRKGIKIWDGNTSRAFLDSRGLSQYNEGILGPGYGWAMRHFGGAYNPAYADSRANPAPHGTGFDQLEHVLYLLRTDPLSRRIMMCYWNPCDFDKIALVPCHYSVQFYVEEEGDGKPRSLSCHLVMRSNDLFLGNPLNIFGYAVLTHILAAKTGMRPKELIYTGSDVHIYTNHVDAVIEQLLRDPRPLPRLIMNPAVAEKDWSELVIDDFDIVGYFPHPAISAPMAV